jgi:hypothetical protein
MVFPTYGDSLEISGWSFKLSDEAIFRVLG